MYIYRFLVDSVTSATNFLFKRGDETAKDAATKPLKDPPLSHYGTGDTRNNAPRDEELLGLTADYQSWSSSDQARKTAFRHLGGYLVLVVVCFSFVFEKWSIVESLYFAVVVFTTVGYGDLSPSNNTSRFAVMVFAFYGIVILGIFLGLVGDFILERYESRTKDKISNAQLKVMEQFSAEDSALPARERSFFGELWDVCRAEAPIILCLIAAGSPIAYIEGWDVVQGLYWMLITGSTVGFGDLQPSSATTRCIAIVWIPLAVAVLGEFLGQIAGIYLHRRDDEMERRFLARAMTLSDVGRMDTDHDGKVSAEEFLVYMLISLQKVEKEDIDGIRALFGKFDKDHDGNIEKKEILQNYSLSVKPGVTVNAAALTAMSTRQASERGDTQ